MYKIIGADGSEYGPVTIDQLRQWIREGRANARTKAQAEGATEWKTLSELAEFADALRAASGAAAAPPVVGVVDAEALAAEILARDYRIDIGRCIGRGWELVKANFWLLVGSCFLVFVIMAAVGAIPILGVIAGLIVDGVLLGGLYLLFLKRIRGESAAVGDAFAGFSLAFVQLMLAQLVVGLLSSVGFLLCILPGVYLAVAWSFAVPLVIDKKLDFWPAMELSRKVISHHWWTMFGLLIVAGLVFALGVLGCVVGVFITGSIATAALMYAYEDVFGAQTTAQNP
ncbi:MAG TPA: GYF domain-containing protein [Verrucomicrobiae bacterium]|nr:GYF domain-containing protein [Verrucomicrobiae bacterium]